MRVSEAYIVDEPLKSRRDDGYRQCEQEDITRWDNKHLRSPYFCAFTLRDDSRSKDLATEKGLILLDCREIL